MGAGPKGSAPFFYLEIDPTCEWRSSETGRQRQPEPFEALLKDLEKLATLTC